MTLPAFAMNVSNFPQAYERFLVVPLFQPFAEVLVDRARLQTGDSVLDIACGTGIVSRLARKSVGDGATIVGIDLSAPMLAVARTAVPGVEFREGSAVQLPVADSEKFDAVLCHQGLQFFPDKPAAAREMMRVLKPGGRLALGTWRPKDEIPLNVVLQRVAERHVGTIVDNRHGFGDDAAISALLEGAGLEDVKVDNISRLLRFEEGETFIRMNTMALVGMSATGKQLSDEERGRRVDAIVAESVAESQSFFKGRALEFELRSNVASAIRV